MSCIQISSTWWRPAAHASDLAASVAKGAAAGRSMSSRADGAGLGKCRLKQQLVVEQEEEEDKVRWRVEAEVRLAREELAAEQALALASQSHASAAAQVASPSSQPCS